MKLLKKKVQLSTKNTAKEKPARKSNTDNKLPPDTYKDEITPIELVVDDRKKIVISVKRGGDLGLPMVDIRVFATTETYTGFTKKGINLPLGMLVDLTDSLIEVQDLCEEKKLFEEEGE